MNCLAILIVLALLAVSYGCDHVCGNPNTGPVLGGVDFVQLKYQYENKIKTKLLVLGSKTYAYSLGGYQFWFQSQDSLEKFTSQPESYYPQFGGYCADCAWGLTGYDTHADDPSGYCFVEACINSTNGFTFYESEGSFENFWFLKKEAKTDMIEKQGGLDSNIAAARKNFESILVENNAKYCFSTDNIKTCA